MSAEALKFRFGAKFAVLIACFLALFLMTLTRNMYLITVLIFSCIWAVFAATFDLVSAYTNQINLGHAIFFGVGGYTAAFLSIHMGLPPFITLLLGAIASTISGLILGGLCLRVRGPYLLLTTVLANIVLLNLVYSFSRITGGEDGLPGVKRIFISPEYNYYFLLSLMIVSVALLVLMVNSRIGYAFKALRDDEDAAEALGINVVKYKLIAFTTASFFLGLVGAAYAHYLGIVGPTTLSSDLVFMAIVMAIMGGWGTIIGPVIGSFILTPLNEYLRIIGAYRTLIWGIIAIIIIMKMPGGILKSITALSEKIKGRGKGN